MVQEKAAWYRKPVPIRYPQPLSQTLRVCQLPLHRGAKPCGGRGFPPREPRDWDIPGGGRFAAPCFSFPFAGNHKIQHFSVDLPEKSTYNQVVKTRTFPEGGAI